MSTPTHLHSRPIIRSLAILATLSLLILSPDRVQAGNITGSVRDTKSGEMLPSVNILVKGTSLGAATDNTGRYTIKRVPAGSHTLLFTLVGYSTLTRENVDVAENTDMIIDVELTAADVALGEVSVYGASLKRERITEAPAAVSVIDPRDIKLNASHGQLPRLLETQPGVDIVQSGMQDFNINTRGFNSSLNRRLLVLMDGRDVSIAFLGSQEWNGLTIPLEDIGRLELVRGPGSALYGPNAFNGVINVNTPAPRDMLGTKFSYSLGELNSVRSDIRQAALLGNGWSYKVNFGLSRSNTWSKSRTLADTNSTGDFEYTGLRKSGTELRPLDQGPVGSTYGSMRLDYNFDEKTSTTIEGGISEVRNELFVTGIGRVQVMKAQKPWGRLNYGSDHLNVNIWAQGRNSLEPQYSLASGGALKERSQVYHGEVQYNFSPVADQMRIIVGASHRLYHVDTDSTLMPAARYDNTTGLLAQAEYSPVREFKFVAASRWDRSTLHSDQFSPKGAIVWSPTPDHSVRATINKAFQVPNYSEYFLQVVAGRTNLAAFGGTGADPIYARGNKNLQVEKIVGYELGYKGIFLEKKLFLSLDAYYNRATNFVTDLLPGVNPDYAFNPPPGFPAGLADIARTNGIYYANGRPQVVVSYSNAGKVDERGVEAGFNVYVTNDLHFEGSWTWYDFEVKEQQAGDILLPNAPKHKFSLGATYRSPAGFEIAINGRNVQAFRWAAGVFQGEIPAYTLLNLATGYKFNQSVRLGASVSNVFDNKAYQIFGGSVIGRQAIGNLTITF